MDKIEKIGRMLILMRDMTLETAVTDVDYTNSIYADMENIMEGK